MFTAQARNIGNSISIAQKQPTGESYRFLLLLLILLIILWLLYGNRL